MRFKPSVVAAVLAGVMLIPMLPGVALAAPQVFVVNSILDTGDASPDGVCNACTLREAIQEANANGNPSDVDVIAFGIPGAGVHTIAVPTSALPGITQPVRIDGYSQSGALANTNATISNATINIFLDGTGLAGLVPGLEVNGPDVTVRGLAVGNFTSSGILINDGATNTTIEGNYVGLDATGTLVRPNRNGIDMGSGATGVLIGGTTPAARNVISGNSAAGGGNGITNFSSGTTNVTIQGNLIGTNDSGVTSAANANNGIVNRMAPGENWLIGGTTPGAGNLIAGNIGDGVIAINSGSGLQILGNRFFGNGELAIDLDENGVTENDNKDKDGVTSANHLQNFPVLTLVPGAGNTIVKATLNSTPKKKFRIEFLSSLVADPSGNGEGEVVLGFKNVKTNKKGRAKVTFDTGSVLPVATVIAATATKLKSKETSEFSDVVTVT